MMVYYGSLGIPDELRKIKAEGDGRLVTAADWKNPFNDEDPEHPVNGLPWCLDNGAFTSYNDWLQRKKRGEPVPKKHGFDGGKFFVAMNKTIEAVDEGHRAPDFVVLPDIVAGGRVSLRLSLSALQILPDTFSYYLAVQDGMKPSVLDEPWRDIVYGAETESAPLHRYISGLFVGGSMKWKLRTSERWIREAHKRGLEAHIGRVATVENLVWARRIGADSVDSAGFYRGGRQGKPNKQHYVPGSRAQRLLTEVHDAAT